MLLCICNILSRLDDKVIIREHETISHCIVLIHKYRDVLYKCSWPWKIRILFFATSDHNMYSM